jgi:hypothetical protein
MLVFGRPHGQVQIIIHGIEKESLKPLHFRKKESLRFGDQTDK